MNTTLKTKSADQLRAEAEYLAASSVNIQDKAEAWLTWDQAWELSEQAYDLDNRNEPSRHMEYMERMGKAIVRVTGGRY